MSDLYATLGVDKTASADEIKKAYRKLASKHHPDKGGDTKKFQEIQAAYETLGDEHKRAEYDAPKSSFRFGFRGSNFDDRNFDETNMEDMEDILRHLRTQFGGQDPWGMGGGFSRRWQQQKPKNRDMRVILGMTLADTLEEVKKTIKIKTPSGEEVTLDLTIPRGVQDGATIRYAGLGDQAVKNAPRGDIYVNISINQDMDFVQVGLDLMTTIVVNSLEAIVGCEKEVKTLEGKTIKLTIPAGTNYGAKFGVPNFGLYMPNSDQRGRLIVEVLVNTPTTLTEDQLEKIKQVLEAVNK